MSTLRFGNRAKEITTTPTINQIKSRKYYKEKFRQAHQLNQYLLGQLNDCCIDIQSALEKPLLIQDCVSYERLLKLKKDIKRGEYENIIDKISSVNDIMRLKRKEYIKKQQQKREL
eukprot:320070_1